MGRQTLEGLKSADEAVGIDKVSKVLQHRRVIVIVDALDDGFLDGPIHQPDRPIGLWMLELGEAMFDAAFLANSTEHLVNRGLEFGDREPGRPVDGHDEIEPAIGCLQLCNVDMEVANGVVLELLLGRLVALQLSAAARYRAAADSGTAASAPDARWPTAARKQWQLGMPAKAQPTASSSTNKTAERGCLGPVGRSATEARFLQFATVF